MPSIISTLVAGLMPVAAVLAAAMPGPLSSGLVRRQGADGPLEVDVYAHVISSEADKPIMKKENVDAQLAVLDSHYKQANVSFKLRETQFRTNPKWSSGADNVRMRFTLHKGGPKALNLYFLEETQWKGRAAMCYYPITLQRTYQFEPEEDGCVIRAQTTPDPSRPDVKGKDTVDEVGHWFNVDGAFDGTCNGPAETCKWDFTPEKIETLREGWKIFRTSEISRPAVELKPLKPELEEGKLPYYPNPESAVATLLQCSADTEGNYKETREEYCGTLAWCGEKHWQRDPKWKQETNSKEYYSYAHCAAERAHQKWAVDFIGQ